MLPEAGSSRQFQAFFAKLAGPISVLSSMEADSLNRWKLTF